MPSADKFQNLMQAGLSLSSRLGCLLLLLTTVLLLNCVLPLFLGCWFRTLSVDLRVIFLSDCPKLVFVHQKISNFLDEISGSSKKMTFISRNCFSGSLFRFFFVRKKYRLRRKFVLTWSRYSTKMTSAIEGWRRSYKTSRTC